MKGERDGPTREEGGGRCWVRTSDPCRVKAFWLPLAARCTRAAAGSGRRWLTLIYTRISTGALALALAACGGGGHAPDECEPIAATVDQAVQADSAAGLAAVELDWLGTGELHVAATVHVRAGGAARRWLSLSIDGDSYSPVYLDFTMPGSWTVTLTHRLNGTETNNRPVQVSVSTLLLEGRSEVTGISVSVVRCPR